MYPIDIPAHKFNVVVITHLFTCVHVPTMEATFGFGTESLLIHTIIACVLHFSDNIAIISDACYIGKLQCSFTHFLV